MTTPTRIAKIVLSLSLLGVAAGGLTGCTVKHDDRIPVSGNPLPSTTAIPSIVPSVVTTLDPKP